MVHITNWSKCRFVNRCVSVDNKDFMTSHIFSLTSSFIRRLWPISWILWAAKWSTLLKNILYGCMICSWICWCSLYFPEAGSVLDSSLRSFSYTRHYFLIISTTGEPLCQAVSLTMRTSISLKWLFNTLGMWGSNLRKLLRMRQKSKGFRLIRGKISCTCKFLTFPMKKTVSMAQMKTDFKKISLVKIFEKSAPAQFLFSLSKSSSKIRRESNLLFFW